MRDDFSAGGKCTHINGEELEESYPHIVFELLQNHQLIKDILSKPDEDILNGIKDFWDFPYEDSNLYGSWVKMIESTFHENPQLCFIPICDLLSSGAKPY